MESASSLTHPPTAFIGIHTVESRNGGFALCQLSVEANNLHPVLKGRWMDIQYLRIQKP